MVSNFISHLDLPLQIQIPFRNHLLKRTLIWIAHQMTENINKVSVTGRTAPNDSLGCGDPVREAL